MDLSAPNLVPQPAKESQKEQEFIPAQHPFVFHGSSRVRLLLGIPLRDHDLIEPNVPPVWFNKKQYLKKSARKKEVRFTGRWARKEQLDGKEGLLQGQGITED